VEAKASDDRLSPSLLYFKARLKIPYIYQVLKKEGIDKLEKEARIISASRFLASLI
jgi:hypothetical protein